MWRDAHSPGSCIGPTGVATGRIGPPLTDRLIVKEMTVDPHSPATKSTSTRVVGSPVHALLHVRLVGVTFVGELLLRTGELRGVHTRIVSRHPRAHRVPARVHGIVAIGHWIPQHLMGVRTQVCHRSVGLDCNLDCPSVS